MASTLCLDMREDDASLAKSSSFVAKSHPNMRDRNSGEMSELDFSQLTEHCVGRISHCPMLNEDGSLSRGPLEPTTSQFFPIAYGDIGPEGKERGILSAVRSELIKALGLARPGLKALIDDNFWTIIKTKEVSN
jgi:hypothetical protein